MPCAQEDEGTKEAKNHQLLTEDIDSILARAEVPAQSGSTAVLGNSCPDTCAPTPGHLPCYVYWKSFAHWLMLALIKVSVLQGLLCRSVQKSE